MSKILISLMAGIFIAGCSLSPNLEVDQTYKFQIDSYSIDERWWENFGDERLNSLVAAALERNSDILIALNNISQAKVNLNLANIEFLPNINLQGSGTRTKTSGENYSKQPSYTYNAFSLSAALSYEIDLWGRVRDTARAKKSLFRASQFDYENARLTIISSVANTYFTLISLKEQENILQETLNTYEDTLKYRQNQLNLGAIDELTYYQAKAAVQSAKSQLIAIQTQISQTNSALLILTGENFDNILYANSEVSQSLPTMPEVPSGITSDILMNRPDIASAFENLKAANFMVGVARTSWLPTLSLTGLFGFSSDEFSNFLVSNAKTWSIGGSIVMPLLDFGRTYNQTELASLQKQAALLSYDKAVKTAFGEIRDALNLRENSILKSRSLSELLDSQTKVYERAKSRYDSGYSTHLEFLDAQRNLLSAKLDLAQSNLEVATSVISVYKAFGGGFTQK